MQKNDEFQEKSKLELYLLFSFSTVVVIALLIIAINNPSPTIFQSTTFRTILAIFSAGVVAMIPGWIHLNLGFSHQYIRAGGAISVFLIIYFYNPAELMSEKPAVSKSLAPHVFGENLNNETISLTREEANKKNGSLFNGVKRSVRIVTVHGKSWLQDIEVEPGFQNALRNARVELLIVDPVSDAFKMLKLSQKDGIAKEDEHHHVKMNVGIIKDHYKYFEALFTDDKVKEKSSLAYYSKFPWIRFTIYDDKHATFVLTPFLKTGAKSTIFYTSDPWLIRCLEEIFDEFKASSRTIEDTREYENMWAELQKKYPW